MENLKSKAEFARHCRVSKAAITKAIAAGNVVSDPNGKIDLSHKINVFYATQNISKANIKKSIQNKPLVADDYFLETLSLLNAAKPKLEKNIDRIKNEVAFEIVSLFSTFNTWTNKQFPDDWLIDKCLKWVKSMNDTIDAIE